MFQDKLEKYARLLIEIGLNVQPGQPVVISCSVENAAFGRLCAKHAYDCGASVVEMSWRDDAITRMNFLRAADAVFDECPIWKSSIRNEMAKKGAAFLSITGDDPTLFEGVAQDRLARSAKVNGAALKTYREMAMQNQVQWCVGAVPVPAWAKTVFPGMDEKEAVSRLWDEIFKTVRITDDNNPVEAWKNHITLMTERKEKLNAYAFHSLRYFSANGTDITVDLPEKHIWGAAQDRNVVTGTLFTPNMPTEEIFTAPVKNGVNGHVVASKPLVLDGTIVEGFSFDLVEGRIVSVQAEKGIEALNNQINMDEGAHYLGEVALVPYDSPISNTGILFYDTLFDENAACHFAFGASYPMVEGADDMTAEERLAVGLNDSMTHVDFMIGTEDLSIIGITNDGEEVTVFRNGNFAI